MSTARLLLALWLPSCLALAWQTSWTYPPQMPGATEEVYKTVGATKLNLYIFKPEGTPTVRRAAIILFFGGGWANGSPAQFETQCRRLASRGMVAIAADYRVRSRNQSSVSDSIRDAKSAIRYVRQNAARLGLDPDRIAAGGGSAGGAYRRRGRPHYLAR